MKYESLDIETIWDDEVAKPICIAITCGNTIHFKKVLVSEVNSLEIVKFMMEKCSERRVYYVHNLSFEIFVFIKYFIRAGIKFRIVSANRVVYAAEIRWGRKKIKLKCSYRLTMIPLKELADLAGESAKGIFPYKILTPELKERMIMKKEMFNSQEEYEGFIKEFGCRINTYKVLESYCKNDAHITKKAVEKFWSIIEGGGLKRSSKILTAAKLSVENFFMEKTVIKKKIALKYDRLLRPWYFGGRTEVFGNPREDEVALHFDWSGMYAQCMSEKVLGGDIIESEYIREIEQPGFYYIRFRQELQIPVLPIKRDKLLFANGEFEGWYWFEEILLAIEEGVDILEVRKFLSTQYYGKFMKEFIEKNNKIREKGGLYKQIGKNNNNTLYGRMGMNPERYEEEIMSEVGNWNEYEKIIEQHGIFMGYKKSEKSVSNILISAHITSKARVKLYKGMKEVEKVGGRILYSDTDSIIASFKKSSYVEALDKNLGEVYFDSDKQDTLIEEGVFAMPKTYGIKYVKDQWVKGKNLGKSFVKIKGFNVKPSFEEFKEAFYTRGSITTTNEEWSKKDFSIRREGREKTTWLTGLDKRNWSSDLKETTPRKL